MIALLRTSSEETQLVQQRFLTMLPRIRRQALAAFRSLRSEARDEFVQEVIALAYSAFVRLVRRDKIGLAFPTMLARYAIRQVRAGRRVGCRQNVNDIMAPDSRRTQRPMIQRLEAYHERTGELNQLLFEDRRAGPAETAAVRLDLTAWFNKLSPRNRRIARAARHGRADQCRGAALRADGRSDQPTPQLASRALGRVPGRVTSSRLCGLIDGLFDNDLPPSLHLFRCRLGFLHSPMSMQLRRH